MYKKITVVTLLLLGCLVFFARQPQAMASSVAQQATATPAAEEESASSEVAADETMTDSTTSAAPTEVTLESLAQEVADLRAEVEELHAHISAGQSGEASANEVTTAIYFLDTAGLHALDERLNNDKEIQAADAGNVSRVANLLSSVNWPEAMASDAANLIDILNQLSTALGNDDVASAAELSTQAHEAQHAFSHGAEHWLADQPAASGNSEGQAFRVTAAVYLLDTVGLHGLSERLSTDKEIQAADAGNVSRIANLLATVDWPDTLATDAISLTTTLNDLATALGNDDLEAATPLADTAHESQHAFSHAAGHWLADAMGAHTDEATTADDHTHADAGMDSSETITGTDVMSDTQSSGG